MRGRFPAPSGISYAFGPGPLTPAIKALIIANVVAFIATSIWPALEIPFRLQPYAVFSTGAVWQLVTYMFLHGGPMHLIFNMLMLWMFGVEIERMWGTTYFTKYYFACGIGAGLTQVLLGLLPFSFAASFWLQATIGASGAIFGVLLAYALYFPTRPILFAFVFPVQARYVVMILGGISLWSAVFAGGGVAHTAHLGGLATGYLYLKGKRVNLLSEIQYRYLKWRINRMRKKFDVYSGGRGDDVDRRVH